MYDFYKLDKIKCFYLKSLLKVSIESWIRVSLCTFDKGLHSRGEGFNGNVFSWPEVEPSFGWRGRIFGFKLQLSSIKVWWPRACSRHPLSPPLGPEVRSDCGYAALWL